MEIVDRIKEIQESGTHRLEDILDSKVEPEDARYSRLKNLFAQTISEDPANRIALAAGVLTIGDLLYDVARLDPLVLKALDFSRAADLASPLSFAAFAEHTAGLNQAAQAGTINALQGFVAERVFAQHLQSRGFEVEFPSSPNQPGYDLLVGGSPYQVKNVLDPRHILNHRDRYPDIPVITNAEMAEHFPDTSGVLTLPIKHAEIVDRTHTALGTGKKVLDLEVPAIVLAIATGRAVFAVVRGKSTFSTALPAALVDSAGMAAGGIVGSKAFALVGSILGPYGTVVGSILGTVAGARQGFVLVQGLKRRIWCQQEEAAVNRASSALLLRTAEIARLRYARIESKAEEIKQHTVSKGSEGKNLWRWFRKRIEDELLYLTNKIDRTTEAAGKYLGADPQARPFECARNSLAEAIGCGIPEVEIRTEVEALHFAVQNLQKAYGRVLTTQAR